MHPGCHVVCINDEFKRRDDARAGVRYPVKGVVYTVRAVHQGISILGPAYLLEEIVNPKLPYKFKGIRIGILEKRFDASRFRPLAKLKVEDFTGTLAPAKIDA